MKTAKVRIPESLWQELKVIATENKVSYNEVVVQALQKAVREDGSAKLSRDFHLLAENPEDVEWAFAAQAEVVFKHLAHNRERFHLANHFIVGPQQ